MTPAPTLRLAEFAQRNIGGFLYTLLQVYLEIPDTCRQRLRVIGVDQQVFALGEIKQALAKIDDGKGNLPWRVALLDPTYPGAQELGFTTLCITQDHEMWPGG